MSLTFPYDEALEINFAFRITSQFNHLAEIYFSGFKFDLGERQLGYLASFDLDVDTFTASIGLAKTSIETVLKEDGTNKRFRALVVD